MEKYNIDRNNIGRVEVGTETITDKSKATKTFLMDLFPGNTDIEGIDTKNACYGGTNALFNSIQWIESSAWDGRLAICVAADIAVYSEGNARPTGGAGAVAMLIGPNAPLVFERGLRHTYMENVWDFYKPNPLVEYPTVDGQLSNNCYLRSLDSCYRGYSKKFSSLNNGKPWSINEADFVCFHSPYNKLVQKSFARMLYNDFLASPNLSQNGELERFLHLKPEESYTNRELESVFLKRSVSTYNSKVKDGAMLPKEIGNVYTASLYSSLVALISSKNDLLVDKRILLFSYGSGSSATLFSLSVKSSIKFMSQKIDLKSRLESRIFVDPVDYTTTMNLRHQRHNELSFKPSDPIDSLFPGTWYLTEIDSKQRRFYSRFEPKIINSKL